MSSEERSEGALKIKLAGTLIVGASMGLITLQGDVPLWVTGVAVLAGLVVGAALVWFVFPGTGEVQSRAGRRR
ncbi:hypothetical protein N0B31_07750 [Salinirubellus salinus]|uniref:Uncharacterized protein n=2 Tax=Salinirubellus salinus TaxID=1364945 RepID=A0A9E7U9Q0_9EURY|nr:hypothetical protein [Salinirubellus salinus]UWM56176.1 hypothetical protein N0B31_07750 [Salinirubellus salinus]